MTGPDWARCAPWIDAALAHAGRSHALSDVQAMVEDGEAQLWVGAGAAMVTIIEDEPRERRLLIWLAGGDLDELVQGLRPAAERWAKAQGCRRVLVVGRPGWERALAPEGYAPLARIIAKEL
ncbi:MAG: hypothetical protein EPO51_16605 [Phenylobacterium sp.]|uniref:hypothetical protein n=1 Tax=Phenylobacterium sp. TaxID=1871053 RepID=UPI0012100757|nr:hypothetical protein [Phenylobacterium sp.]TAJ70709.1 MAG: hypothetical protein EPO51_16605 [Phenylobacterium sp.]